jgi:predicted PurR-regulated permease PerM
LHPPDIRRRLLLVTASIIVVLGLLMLARGALFPFILSGALAYLLYPVVRALERLMPWRERWQGPSRIFSILVVYVAALAVLAGALAIVVPPALRQASDFVDDVPDLLARARTTVEGWNEEYTSRIPIDVREQIEETLEGGSSILIAAARTVLTRTVSTVANTLTTVIGLAVVPFMVFYLLKDREEVVGGFYSLMPPEAQRHTANVVAIVNRVVGAYVRAQLTLAVVAGVAVFLGLYLLGIRFAVLLAVIAGVSELIPVIGPLIGAIPGILVTLATSPEDLVWVILLYVGIQLVQNAFLAPRIQGQAVELHPVLIMVILVIASEVAGLWGVILAVPVAAVARDVFKYFYQEWSEESAGVDGQLDANEVSTDLTTALPEGVSPEEGTQESGRG